MRSYLRLFRLQMPSALSFTSEERSVQNTSMSAIRVYTNDLICFIYFKHDFSWTEAE
jgi:hypothetical protein